MKSKLVQAYMVDDKPTTHGSITLSKDCFPTADYTTANETVTVTVTPDEGYQLKSLVYNDGTKDYDITATKTFTMPKANVTVKAEFDVPHTHKDADDKTVTFKPIADLAALIDLFAAGGSGYLTKDIDADGVLTVNADVDLCLNDKVLNLKGQGNIVVNTGKTFNLYDCGEGTTRCYDKAESGLWTLKASGESKCFTIGGVITGGKAEKGGGVYTGGTFNMYGGNIVGNQTTGIEFPSNGAGIYITGGTFTMNGGTICGNAYCYFGGGVFVGGSGTFTLNDGTISCNKATAQGGGVYINGKNNPFTMNGGILSENAANTASAVMDCGMFIMNGGEIKGHTGDAVTLWSGTAVFGGTAVVKNNKSNIYGSDKYSIMVGDGTTGKKPENGMKVGLKYGNNPVECASAGDEIYFFCDNPAYLPVYDNGAIRLLTKIAVPTAKTDLVYNGDLQTGVAAGEGYTLEGNTATDAGTYTAIATLADGYVWADGSTDAKTIEWTIDVYAGGMMGVQVSKNDAAGGRTIIGLKEDQLEKITDKVVIVGSDGTKDVMVEVDCAYTYFYNWNSKTEQNDKIEANTGDLAGYAAFIILDNDGKGGSISGYGYYRLYLDRYDAANPMNNLLFDVLYTAPVNE